MHVYQESWVIVEPVLKGSCARQPLTDLLVVLQPLISLDSNWQTLIHCAPLRSRRWYMYVISISFPPLCLPQFPPLLSLAPPFLLFLSLLCRPLSFFLSFSLPLSLTLSHVHTLTHRCTTKLFVTFFYPRLPWTSEKMDKRDWSSLVSPDTPPRQPTRSFQCWRLGIGIGLSTQLMPMLPRLVPMLYSRSASQYVLCVSVYVNDSNTVYLATACTRVTGGRYYALFIGKS